MLDPIIEKYSIFLTITLLQIISNHERFSTINEILLSNPDQYLSTEEVLKICLHEQILSHDDLLRICRETFLTPTLDQSNRKSLHFNTDRRSEEESNPEDSTTTFWSSAIDCYSQNISIYIHDSTLRKRLDGKVLLSIFDGILHFNHRTLINGQLEHLFNVFKPLAIYTAQLLIEKEMIIIRLLLKTRKEQQGKLTIEDLNRYLEAYPIPCRL